MSPERGGGGGGGGGAQWRSEGVGRPGAKCTNGAFKVTKHSIIA